MKKYIALLTFALSLFACQKEEISITDNLPYVDLVSNSGLGYGRGVQIYYSNFYYKGTQVQTDTVWIQLMSRAAVPQKDCKVNLYAYTDSISSLQQGSYKATEGTQFASLSSPEMQNLLVFHKGLLYDSIPVVLKRDPSLKNRTYCITLRLGNSDDIKAADQTTNTNTKHTFVEIYVSDGLAQPSNWPSFLGKYGQVKHDFIIRHTGEKWDQAFISTIDYTQYTYYQYKFYYELIQENAERQAQGLPKLAEADGTLVEFYLVGS